MSFENKEKVEVEKGLLVRAYAVLATGSYVPSMFAEVRDIMINLDAKFGENNEVEPANGTDSNGSEG